MSNEKKCAWYADYEGVCTNADSPYCTEWCPISGELGMCRFDKPNGASTPEYRRFCPPPPKKIGKAMRILKSGDLCPCCGKPIPLTDPDALRLLAMLADVLGLPDAADDSENKPDGAP